MTDSITPQLITDSHSLDFLKQLKSSGKCDGKVVLGCMESSALVALGPIDLFHVAILERASAEVLHTSLVDTPDPDLAKPLPGVLVQGGRFNVYWPSNKVVIYGTSLSFGSFEDGIWSRSTQDVVADHITGLVSAMDG